MGIKATLKKIHSTLVSPIKFSFVLGRNSKTMRKLGKAIYGVGLKRTVKRISEVGEIVSIYSKTDFSDDFIPGISDIDLVVASNVLECDEEIVFLKKLYSKWNRTRIIFPFISPLQIYSKKEFEKLQNRREILRKKISDWELIYGKDVREKTTQNKISNYEIRWSFENLLLNIYESEIMGERYFRRLYKTAKYIFSLPKKIELDEDFVKTFNEIPENDYVVSKETLLKTLFYAIKTLEKNMARTGKIKATGDTIISKIQIRGKPTYVYFIIGSENYEKFRTSALDIFEKIKEINEFKKHLKNKPKARFGEDFKIFPLIVSREILNSEFVGGFYPDELIEIRDVHKKALLKSFESYVSNFLHHQKNSFFYRSWLKNSRANQEIIDYTIAYKLLRDKGIIEIKNLEKKYEKCFGRALDKKEKSRYKFIKETLEK